jgi:hypothetical protein
VSSTHTEVTVPMAALQNKTALLIGATRRIGCATQLHSGLPGTCWRAHLALNGSVIYSHMAQKQENAHEKREGTHA